MKKEQLKEISATGSKGEITVSGGNMIFGKSNKKYYVSLYDLDIKILDKNAILKTSNVYENFGNHINYSQRFHGLKNRKILKKEIKAYKREGCLYKQDPWIFTLENKDISYEIWHQNLEIKIIDKDAAFFEYNDFDKLKNNLPWDGILDYSSESMIPAPVPIISKKDLKIKNAK